MSKSFTQLKSPTLGLDSVLDFGRHSGYTILEIIKDQPDYIRWLIKEGKSVYPSVLEELIRHEVDRSTKGRSHQYLYYGDLHGDLAHETMSQIQAAIDEDWLEDVPF